MYKQIIDYISEVALKHIVVNKVKYQSRTLINAQNSNANYQVIIEDDPYFQHIRENGCFTLSLNIDIISHISPSEDILVVQSIAHQVAAEIIAYIERDDYFRGLIKVYDYDFLGLSHFTDDDSAGMRLTLQLVVPSPVNLCTINENFDEDLDFNVEKEDNIDLDTTEECDNNNGGLILNPIKLPHK